jgi:hypothetical protein
MDDRASTVSDGAAFRLQGTCPGMAYSSFLHCPHRCHDLGRLGFLRCAVGVFCSPVFVSFFSGSWPPHSTTISGWIINPVNATFRLTGFDRRFMTAPD